MGRLNGSRFVDFFTILEQYRGTTNSPTHLSDLPAFEKECRSEGFHELASWIENWRLNLEYHISREHTE